MKNIERTDDCFDNPWERDGEICEIHNEEILLDPVEMTKVCLHCKFNFPSDNQAFSVHWIDPPSGFIGGEIATTRKNMVAWAELLEKQHGYYCVQFPHNGYESDVCDPQVDADFIRGNPARQYFIMDDTFQIGCIVEALDEAVEPLTAPEILDQILNCKLENGLMDRQEYIEMKTKELFEALKISH